MDRSPRIVALQYEHARPLRVFWIIFDWPTIPDPRDHFPDEDTILRQLVVPVLGNSYLAPSDQIADSVERGAHHSLYKKMTYFQARGLTPAARQAGHGTCALASASPKFPLKSRAFLS
jgi:hypothetical protein